MNGKNAAFGLALLVTTVAILVACVPQGQRFGLMESFGDPALPGWVLAPGASVVGGVLRVGQGGFASRGGDWQNLALKVHGRRQGKGDLLVCYRWREDGAYCVRLEADRVTLQRGAGGEVVDLSVAPAHVPDGEWVEVRVEVSDGAHSVALNGNSALAATDPDPLPPGGLAFGVGGAATGEFDNLSVTVGPATPVSVKGQTEETEPVFDLSAGEAPPAYQADAWAYLGGPIGGLGYDIRYSFSDYDRWYVTDARGGFFISTNRGQTWWPSNENIDRLEGTTTVPIFSATVDPHDPDTIWIGTQYSGHIFKSTDGGLIWNRMDNGVNSRMGMHFRGFTVHPYTPTIVYAAAEIDYYVFHEDGDYLEYDQGMGGRVFRTTDGGLNWTMIWQGEALARYVWINPDDPNELYVSTGFFDREPLYASSGERPGPLDGVGVVKSTDGGLNWTELNGDNGLEHLYLSSMYMKPDDPQTLLAAGGCLFHSGSGWYQGGVFLTTNGGQDWEAVIDDEFMTAVEYCDHDPQIAYAGTQAAIYRSEDGGHTWAKYARPEGGWGPPDINPGVPVDFQTDPENCDRVFINNYQGGNFLSTDGGKTWKSTTQGYTGSDSCCLYVDPGFSAHVYAGGTIALFSSWDGGWNWQGISKGSDVTLAVDPADPKHILYVIGERGGNTPPLYETTDGGATWEKRLTLLPPPSVPEENWISMRVERIAFAPSAPDVVYGATLNPPGDLDAPLPPGHIIGTGVYSSTDGGTTWAPANDANIERVGFKSIAVHPTDPQTVYVGAVVDGGIFKTTDGGTTWVTATQGLPQPYGRFSTLAIDSEDPQTIYAGGTTGMFKSENGGASWTQLTDGLSPFDNISSIVLDPTDSQVIYVGTGRLGMFYSTDGGQTFQPLNQGLDLAHGHLPVDVLAISSDGTVLYAATNGHGIHRLGTPQVEEVYLPLVLATAGMVVAPACCLAQCLTRRVSRRRSSSGAAYPHGVE